MLSKKLLKANAYNLWAKRQNSSFRRFKRNKWQTRKLHGANKICNLQCIDHKWIPKVLSTDKSFKLHQSARDLPASRWVNWADACLFKCSLSLKSLISLLISVDSKSSKKSMDKKIRIWTLALPISIS